MAWRGRLVIAGTQSGVGKTTVTVGLIDALRRRGLTVQPFKVGPDYIDPSYHTLAAGRPCRNLDTWLLPAKLVKTLFTQASGAADIAIVEGVMGLYDGYGYDNESGSTAEVAKLLAAPVIIVLDAGKLARSAGALALGYVQFDKDLRSVGFIGNTVASASHGHGVATAVEEATGLPVLGWLPREKSLHVAERQLGLIPTAEPGRWSEFAQTAGEVVDRHLDLVRLLAVAHDTLPLSDTNGVDVQEPAYLSNGDRPVIAVARDEAFHFTYEDNLDLLRNAGAEIAFFSPLHDEALPAQTGVVILSGGFPEIYARQLSANRVMHDALRAAHERGLPLYAECGGLMYLAEAIVDAGGIQHSMVGLLPGRCIMEGRLTLGYRQAQSAGDSWFLAAGETIRGHEFHYSKWEQPPANLPPAYVLLPRTGEGQPREDGTCIGNLWASYVHVHFGTKPELARRFVDACRPAARKAVAGGRQ
jgi:cobyrinic acid a,c-diamide synthase